MSFWKNKEDWKRKENLEERLIDNIEESVGETISKTVRTNDTFIVFFFVGFIIFTAFTIFMSQIYLKPDKEKDLIIKVKEGTHSLFLHGTRHGKNCSHKITKHCV